MKRFVVGVLVVLGFVAAVPAAAQASTASLKGFVCQTGKLSAQRAMSITAVMRPLPDTARMQLRFELLKRAHRHGPSTSVSGPGLKTWTNPKDLTLGSRPGDTWIVKHPVVELAAPAWYRFRVTFRWLGSSGEVLGEASHRSKPCSEPGPDLKMVKGWAAQTTPGEYVAVIQNVGSMKSSPFRVQVTDDSPNGGVLAQGPQLPYQALSAGSTVKVSLTGMACHANDMLDITVSPDESDDGDNPTDDTIMTTCPPAPQASPALKRKHRTAPVRGVRGR